MTDPTETVTLSGVPTCEFEVGEVWEFRGDRRSESGTVTAVDHRSGTVTVTSIMRDAKAALEADDYIFREGYAPFSFARGDVINSSFTIPYAPPDCDPIATNVGHAAIYVVTTVAALEWLRRRKAAVQAAEQDEAAYRELLAEFVAWLRGWLERLGMVTRRERA